MEKGREGEERGKIMRGVAKEQKGKRREGRRRSFYHGFWGMDAL